MVKLLEAYGVNQWFNQLYSLYYQDVPENLNWYLDAFQDFFQKRQGCTRFLLIYIESLFRFWCFLGNMASWACLPGFGLKFIFHCTAESLILLKLLFKLFAEVFVSWTTERRQIP